MNQLIPILSLLIGYILGRLHTKSNEEVTQQVKRQVKHILSRENKNVGVVTGITPEQLAIRKDPKLLQEEKDGEEIFEKVLGK